MTDGIVWLVGYFATLLTDGDVSRATPYWWEVATAIVLVAPSAEDRLVLATIAVRESGLREDVGRCAIIGRAGDRGAWQVVPRSAEERRSLCVSTVHDARIALGRVYESVGACRRLPRAERLAVYARGRCDSEEGRRLSRQRWPPDAAVQDFKQIKRQP